MDANNIGSVPINETDSYGLRQRGELKVGSRQTAAMQKPWGMRNVNSNSALDNTRLVKLTAESDFDAVRIHFFHGGSTTTEWKMAVAATETADTSTQANLAQSIVGGAAQNALDSATDMYGWRTVTWASASTKTLAGTGTATSPEVITSDWISLQSVPRADGGTLPLLMIMAYPTNAAAQTASWINPTGSAAMRTSSAANRGRIIQSSRGTGDAIATPGSVTMTLVVDSVPIAVEYRYSTMARSVMGIGDSLIQNQALVADNYSNWLHRACADISTTTRPVHHYNMGASSSTSSNYWTEGLAQMVRVKPTACVLEVFSPNDGAFSSDGVTRLALQNVAGRVAEFLAYCRANDIRPILFTGLPYYAGLTAARDTLRKTYLATIRTMAINAQCGIIDSDAMFTDGGSPANIVASYNNGDDIHYNEAGVEKLAVAAGPIIREILDNGF